MEALLLLGRILLSQTLLILLIQILLAAKSSSLIQVITNVVLVVLVARLQPLAVPAPLHAAVTGVCFPLFTVPVLFVPLLFNFLPTATSTLTSLNARDVALRVVHQQVKTPLRPQSLNLTTAHY